MDQRAIITSARAHIRKMLDRLPTAVPKAGREAVVDFICDEIKKIPIPVVSTALAKVVETLLSPDKPGGGHDIEDVVRRLDAMQRSDEAFQQGMDDWHIDLGEIQQDIAAIATAVRAQATPELRAVGLRYEERHPILDNRLSAVLLNAGGGTVNAQEIHLTVERWEPLAEVDFTVPAAPMPELALRVTLRVEERDYPLLRLNGEPDRVYNAAGAGAERVAIDMRSEHNARYWVRLRVPYLELTGAGAGELVVPPPHEPPLAVAFTYAPGWSSDVDPEQLLARPAVLDRMTARFREVAAACREASGGPAERARERLREAGVQEWALRGLLQRFVPLAAEIAWLERRPQEALAAIVDLLAAYDAREGERAQLAEQLDVAPVARLAGDAAVEPLLRALLAEPDAAARAELARQVVGRARPLGAAAAAR